MSIVESKREGRPGSIHACHMIIFSVVLSLYLLQHALHAGHFPLSEISIRALAHSWLGFVFSYTERISNDGACQGSSYRTEHLATSYRCSWWWSRSQRP